MLRKLMKYEIKSCGRIFFPFYIVVLVFSIIASVFINLDSYEHDFSILYLLGAVAIFVLFVAAIVLTIVIIIQRFNKSLLEDEGYLMFTIPVSEKKLVLSKLLTALLFIVLTIIVAIISISMVSLVSIYKVSAIVNAGNILDQISNGFNNYLGGIIYYAVSGLVGYAVFILTIYLALTIAHLPSLSKHKVLSTLGALIVISIIENTIAGALELLMSNPKLEMIAETDILGYSFNEIFNLVFSIGNYEIIMLLINLAIVVALFFATTILLEKKLNLE